MRDRITQIAFWAIVVVMALAVLAYAVGGTQAQAFDGDWPRIVALVALLAVIGAGVWRRGPMVGPALIWAAVFAVAIGLYVLMELWFTG